MVVQTVVIGGVGMSAWCRQRRRGELAKKVMAAKAVDGGRSSGEIAGLDGSLTKAEKWTTNRSMMLEGC